MKIILFLSSVLISFSMFAQTTITFSGKAQLWGEDSHSNISVQIDGLTAHASGVTDESGNYSINYTYQCTTLPIIGTQCDNNVKLTFSNGTSWEEVEITLTNVTENKVVEDVFLTLLNSTTEICIITHDSLSDNVLIARERLAVADINYVIVSKYNSNFDKYIEIGTLDYGVPGIYEDMNTSDTASEKYKITPVMNSSDTSMSSKPKRSLFLKIDGYRVVGDSVEATLTLSGITDLSLLNLPDSLIVYKSTPTRLISPSRFDFNKYIASAGTNIQDILNNNRLRVTEKLSKDEVTYFQVGLYYDEMCVPSALKTDSGPFSQSISNITESELTKIPELGISNYTMSIIPNPAQNGATVFIPFDGELSIISLDGKTIYKANVNTGGVSIPQQTSGIYKIVLKGIHQIESSIIFE